jgi:hypothetical protein
MFHGYITATPFVAALAGMEYRLCAINRKELGHGPHGRELIPPLACLWHVYVLLAANIRWCSTHFMYIWPATPVDWPDAVVPKVWRHHQFRCWTCYRAAMQLLDAECMAHFMERVGAVECRIMHVQGCVMLHLLHLLANACKLKCYQARARVWPWFQYCPRKKIIRDSYVQREWVSHILHAPADVIKDAAICPLAGTWHGHHKCWVRVHVLYFGRCIISMFSYESVQLGRPSEASN